MCPVLLSQAISLISRSCAVQSGWVPSAENQSPGTLGRYSTHEAIKLARVRPANHRNSPCSCLCTVPGTVDILNLTCRIRVAEKSTKPPPMPRFGKQRAKDEFEMDEYVLVEDRDAMSDFEDVDVEVARSDGEEGRALTSDRPVDVEVAAAGRASSDESAPEARRRPAIANSGEEVVSDWVHTSYQHRPTTQVHGPETAVTHYDPNWVPCALPGAFLPSPPSRGFPIPPEGVRPSRRRPVTRLRRTRDSMEHLRVHLEDLSLEQNQPQGQDEDAATRRTADRTIATPQTSASWSPKLAIAKPSVQPVSSRDMGRNARKLEERSRKLVDSKCMERWDEQAERLRKAWMERVTNGW